MATFIVLLGPPGVGKGTQAKILAERTGLVHISSGDLFRENMKNQTELGKLAQSYINKGELVPDDVTIAMIHDRLSRPDCGAGAILDGFPRTTAQADALAKMLVERLSGRWTCRANGHVFHEKNNPPKQAGACDLDGSELYQRDDDMSETIVRRIQVYLAKTAPLIAYYRQRGKLVEIDGTQNIQKVTNAFLSALKS
jgi:adenylate kinase